MFAESIMDLHPWDYWLKEGTPQPWTHELLSTLESVIKRNPDHHGANHLYIHSVEASKNPEIGLASADKLRFLAPGAGRGPRRRAAIGPSPGILLPPVAAAYSRNRLAGSIIGLFRSCGRAG